MTLVKIDKAPEIFKIRQAQPYVVNPEGGQIYGHYEVRVKWADGTRKTFDSEEGANAFLEKRAVNQAAVQAEIPAGYHRAMEIHNSYLIKDDVEAPEKDEFDVFLVGCEDGMKVSIIKEIRKLTGQGLRESKELATSLPSKLLEYVSNEAAQEAKRALEEVGGKVEIK